MYHKLYLDSIKKGIDNTIYSKDFKKITGDLFFNEVVLIIEKVKQKKGRLFFVGNGASAAFSNHMALDWSKNGGVLAKSLSDSAMLTALANDYSYDEVFVEYLKIEKIDVNDLVVTISSSGNSRNIVAVLKYCNDNKISTIGFSGLKEDNKTTKLSEYSLYVPQKTYGQVECIHQLFLHLWLDQFMKINEWDRDSVQNMNASQFNL